ncbi:MAG: hypothetical protein K6F51_05410 [Acetatifactor sp.]|nr:hypothetical protein [Acetatifactor sp.]
MNEQPQESKKSNLKKYVLNPHTLLILIAVIIIVFIIIRLKNWGIRVDQDYIDQHGIYTDGRDTYDVIYPLMDEDGSLLANKSPHTILFFGNAPFADDRDSENGVVNMIAKATGAKTYNCSVAGSYLAAKSPTLKDTDSGLDVYNFYWLTLYLSLKGLDYFDWLEINPNATALPETKQLRETLETIDMNTVDTIAIMYDGSDYLAGSLMNNPERDDDVMSFTGNLLAGLRVLRAAYPKIRIIVLSPTYAFGVDENGNYVSSDQKIYEGGATLSSYVIEECSAAISEYVSFIDNIYGTFDEDEAPECLKDNLHLNQKGRELLVKRFVSALTQFDQ